MARVAERTIGKRVTFDPATYSALDLYARDSMRTFQELADEAFADLLKKHRRPVDLKDALRQSARTAPTNDNRVGQAPPTKRKPRR